MSFLRVFFIFMLIYGLFKFFRNLFISNTKKTKHWGEKKTSNNNGFYKNITDQKIEDAEYDDVETEKRK